MNLFMYGVLLALPIGVLAGYILKTVQDEKYFKEISRLYEKEIKDRDRENTDRIIRLKQEINRLHALLGDQTMVQRAKTTKWREVQFPHREEV